MAMYSHQQAPTSNCAFGAFILNVPLLAKVLEPLPGHIWLLPFLIAKRCDEARPQNANLY
jgi:hypothetical protein